MQIFKKRIVCFYVILMMNFFLTELYIYIYIYIYILGL